MERESAPLAKALARIPGASQGEPDRDELLSAFLDYVSSLGLTLYPAQEEAILELLGWKHVVLNTPTGSGKSMVALALHFQALAEQRSSYYTSPIKALVHEKFFDLCDVFGPQNVGLLTGDASVNREAPIICCTAEILSNMALRDPKLVVDYVVMDEFHFYGDPERGSAWQIPLISLPNTVFLLMSATLGDMSSICKALSGYTERDVSVISGAERPVPLQFEYRETPLQDTIQDLLQANEAPVYLVNFTQRACAEEAQNLTSINICSREEKQSIGRQLEKVRFDTPYGKELQRFLRAGIGVHHAGLLPKYRLLVEKLSQGAFLKVISGTDSLGVGVNIPIRTVLFHQLCKFNGERTAILTAREFHQVAGRAGRKGFDDHGRVVGLAPEYIAENKRIEAKLIKNPHLKNKLVKKRPPTRNYVHWDDKTFAKLLGSPPEPLVARFEVTHGMIINVLQSPGERSEGGYGRLVALIRRCHLREAEKRKQLRLAAMLFRTLRHAGIIELVPRDGRDGSTVRVRLDLQKEFSLNQTLSLYLIDTLPLLDRESESYSLDLLTLVESILENPTAILLRQVDRIKDELIGQLKAQGVEYEERMAKLEQVEHPKPNADFIYDTFNAFAKVHPWVGNTNINPKSIAREMYEKGMGFADYILDLGMARSEGVLLRYLSQVYKTAVQNVPEVYWTEEFEDILAYFHTMLKRVDSSLIDEWERLMHGELLRPSDRYEEPAPAKPVALEADFKAFSRRIRSELFMILKSLAVENYEETLDLIRPSEQHPWDVDRLIDTMTPYFEAHASIDTTPRARHTQNTFINEVGSRRWEVVHKILDPEGDEDWAIKGIVDLNTVQDESEPLIELQSIGV